MAYVETAKTSHISGLRNCGHTRMVLGYGKSQYASQGRPTCTAGKIPALATAKSVIASAKRLIELRHDWRSNKRMAEIRVPAWPIPIHQTKLTMAKPHPIGMVTPQMPTPLRKRYPRAKSSIMVAMKAMPKPINHPLVAGRVRTIALIFSVTVPKVWPGSMTGARWISVDVLYCSGILSKFHRG